MHTINPDALPLIQNNTAFRMEFDRDGIMEDEILRPMWENQDPGFMLLLTNDPTALMLVVPETDDKIYGLFIQSFVEGQYGSDRRRDAEASMADLIEATKGCTGIIKRLVP